MKYRVEFLAYFDVEAEDEEAAELAATEIFDEDCTRYPAADWMSITTEEMKGE